MLENLKIEIARDSMSVSAIILPEKKNEITLRFVLEELARRGVCAGIDENAIREMIKSEEVGKSFVVAKGVPAKRGRDGYYEFFFDIEAREEEPQIDENGKVKAVSPVNRVEKGQKVAAYHPPREGTIGYTVFDSVIAPMPVKDAEPLQLKNVEKKDNEFYASVMGTAIYKENTLEIVECMMIQGDVNEKNGKLEFSGDMMIQGNVEDGTSIRVGGKLNVQGNMGAADIEVGKNLVVQGEIHGKQKALLRIKGMLAASVIEAADIQAKGNVISGRIWNAKISSENSVSAEGREGDIVGGEIVANEYISASRIGDEKGTPTKLTLVCSDDWSKEYARIIIKDKMFSGTEVQIQGECLKNCQTEKKELHLTESGIQFFEIGTYQYKEIENRLQEENKQDNEKTKSHKEKPLILVVDDDPVFLKTQYTYLMEDYRAVVVNSATDALSFIEKKCPDLILLDYMMPNMNGGQLLEKIRTFPTEETREVPVFFLTSVTDKKVIVQCLSLYPQGYLIKPLSKDELLKILSDFFVKAQKETP